LKTNTLKSKKRLFPNKGYISALALFGYGICNAQVQNNTNIFVSDNSNFYVASGAYNFGVSPAATQTTKTASTYGVVSFASGVTSSGVSNAHNVNGYVRTYGTSQFIFPIGSGTVYAPAAATPSASTGVDAAYFGSNPSAVGTTLGTGATKVSALEYWIIKGTASKISLTWRTASNVTALTDGTLSNLTILGWNGTNWEVINSAYDATSILGGTSAFASGSITSVSNVTLNSYTAFALGKKVEACSELIVSNGITKTWNGSSWSPAGDPTLANPVIITGNYSGSLACNSLTLTNATVTLADGQLLEIVNSATASGTGKVVMSSQSSLIQRNGASTAPPIELTKTTRDARRYDYIYLGTPISENIKPMLANAIATGGSAGAFDLMYQWTSGIGGAWTDLSSTTVGKGYITRVKEQAPFLTQTATSKINLKFTGTANNGNKTVTVVNNTSNPGSRTSYNLLANPYPSAINVDKFLLENTAIDGAVYLWTASTSSGSSSSVTSYTQADYAVYNAAGEVSPNASTPKIAGKIASGQGFMVKSLVNTGTVTFTNCMRLNEGNNNFFRIGNTSQDDAKDRFKLTMTSEGIYSQILIAYIEGATVGYDRLYDASRNSSSTSQLYSIIEPEAMKLAINGRPLFFDTDAVQLGVSQTTTDAHTYTINIDEKEGKFNTGEATAYLHDKALQVYHDFANGPYTFITNELVANNRFEVVYRNGALSNPDFKNATVNAVIKNQTFTVTSSLGMNEIEVYDIAGRKIISYNAGNEKNVSKAFYHADGVYIAKIKLENGTVATQKLINQK